MTENLEETNNTLEETNNTLEELKSNREKLSLHNALIKTYLLCYTRGKGRQKYEYFEMMRSLEKGFDENKIDLYYKYILNNDNKGRMKKKAGMIISDFTNTAFGFKLNKNLQELLLNRIEVYLKTCANSEFGKEMAISYLNDIKNFCTNCVQCGLKYARKIIDEEHLNNYLSIPKDEEFKLNENISI